MYFKWLATTHYFGKKGVMYQMTTRGPDVTRSPDLLRGFHCMLYTLTVLNWIVIEVAHGYHISTRIPSVMMFGFQISAYYIVLFNGVL